LEYEKLTFFECNEDNFKLKENHAYYYQVQAHLHICEAQYGDFVVGSHREFILTYLAAK